MDGDISVGHSAGKSGSPPLSDTLRSKSQRVKDSRGGSMSIKGGGTGRERNPISVQQPLSSFSMTKMAGQEVELFFVKELSSHRGSHIS